MPAVSQPTITASRKKSGKGDQVKYAYALMIQGKQPRLYSISLVKIRFAVTVAIFYGVCYCTHDEFPLTHSRSMI